jgi:hypothetical protein
MGAPHGETAPQDPGHLPHLPRGHPRRSDTHIHPELTTGEPCVRETDKHGSGRGRQERIRTTGTSLAAHFTLRGRRRSNAPSLPGPRAHVVVPVMVLWQVADDWEDGVGEEEQ